MNPEAFALLSFGIDLMDTHRRQYTTIRWLAQFLEFRSLGVTARWQFRRNMSSN
jgi:hypothetical protein